MSGWTHRTHGDLNQEHQQFCNCQEILFGAHRLRRPLAHLNHWEMFNPPAPAVFDDLPANPTRQQPKVLPGAERIGPGHIS